MNRYEEEKMKWDQAFNRCLSDREFAEGLLDQLDKEKEENDDLLSERWADTIAKVESIMSIPAEEHIVRITIGDYSGMDISFEVKGWKEENE